MLQLQHFKKIPVYTPENELEELDEEIRNEEMEKWRNEEMETCRNRQARLVGWYTVLPARLLSLTLCLIEHAVSWKARKGGNKMWLLAPAVRRLS